MQPRRTPYLHYIIVTKEKHTESKHEKTRASRNQQYCYKENICEKKVNMSSNRNTMNHNLFGGYQQYVEHHRQTFPFATPPSYQEWNATFFGAITPSSTSSLSSNKCLMSSLSSNKNSILSPPLSSNDNSIMSTPSTSKNVERERGRRYGKLRD